MPELPRRFVLSTFEARRTNPAESILGNSIEVLNGIARRGCPSVLAHGRAEAADEFHPAGMVGRMAVCVAPELFDGEDGYPMFIGSGAEHNRCVAGTLTPIAHALVTAHASISSLRQPRSRSCRQIQVANR